MLLLYGVPPTETVPDRFVDAPSALVTHRLAASTARPTTTTRLPATGIRPFICPPPLRWNHGQLYPRFPAPSTPTGCLGVVRRGVPGSVTPRFPGRPARPCVPRRLGSLGCARSRRAGSFTRAHSARR